MITVTKTKLPSLEKYNQYLKKIWKANWVTNDGQLVQTLEKKLEEYLGVKNLILVTNGTLALQLPIKALGLKGEVITTPFTFAATTNVIIWEGLTPIFANIDPQTFNLDPDDVERKITPHTSTIIPVHVYNNPCAVEKLQKIATKYKLKIIYDAAHAFGVKHKNQSILNFGDVSTLSFHATKVFNTIEGGAIITKDKKIYEKLRLLRNFGIEHNGDSVMPGINAKMNEFQAAMGLCNLGLVKGQIKKRKQLYQLYKRNLSDIPGIQFQRIVTPDYNYSYMPVLFLNKETRDNIYNKLASQDIYPRKYFYPLTSNLKHLSGVVTQSVRDELSVTNSIADRIMCLPLYGDLKNNDVKRICWYISNNIQ